MQGTSRSDKGKLARKAVWFIIKDGNLYKRDYSLPLHRCLDRHEANYIMRESTKTCMEITRGPDRWQERSWGKAITCQPWMKMPNNSLRFVTNAKVFSILFINLPSSYIHNTALSFCIIGSWLDWSSTLSGRTYQVCSHDCGLFHKLRRGKGFRY